MDSQVPTTPPLWRELHYETTCDPASFAKTGRKAVRGSEWAAASRGAKNAP